MGISTGIATATARGGEEFGELRRSFEDSPLPKALGIELREVRPGHASTVLPPGSLVPGRADTGAMFTLAEQTMAVAATSLGRAGVPVSCDVEFLGATAPGAALCADAWVVDTQGRVARLLVEVSQAGVQVARGSGRIYLEAGKV